MMLRRLCVSASRAIGMPNGVEQRERDASHQADLPIEQAEVFLDRLRQDVEDRAVDEVQNVDDE